MHAATTKDRKRRSAFRAAFPHTIPILAGFYRIDILHKENLIAAMEVVSYCKDHYFVELDGQE